MKWLLFLATVGLLAGCSKKGFFEFDSHEVLLVDDLPQDFPVPDIVWKATLPATDMDKQKPIMYAPIALKIKEKNKGILKEETMAFEFPRGGGELDLDRVTTGSPGTFYMGFEFPEFKNTLQQKVFFISQSRQRKVDGEIIGSGCKKLLDISSDFAKAMTKEGIKLNTTRDRHASTLAGHFVFLAETEKTWLITQLSFFDSKRMDLFCEGFRKAAEKE